jgi:hypothetical protein
MNEKLKLTERELKEIKLALWYEQHCVHGTTGHNRLMIIAKLARYAGMSLARSRHKDVLLGATDYTVEEKDAS